MCAKHGLWQEFLNRIQIYRLNGPHLNQCQLHDPGKHQEVHGDGVHLVPTCSSFTPSNYTF